MKMWTLIRLFSCTGDLHTRSERLIFQIQTVEYAVNGGYDWETYRFRLYYYGSFLAYSMIPKDIAVRTYDYAQKAIDFLGSAPTRSFLPP